MNWQDILKNTELKDISNRVTDLLDELLNSKLAMDGEYHEEEDGYTDSQGVEIFLKYPSDSITVRPLHEEYFDKLHGKMVTEYEIKYDNLLLGYYTGEEGHFITSYDWTDADLPELKTLEKLLEEFWK